MKNTTWTKRMLSLLLCVAMLLSNAPLSASAATNQIAQSAVVDAVTDPGTADSWETMMGTDADGNRYAGRMWVDKSVYVPLYHLHKQYHTGNLEAACS